jgi:hypothetical protein
MHILQSTDYSAGHCANIAPLYALRRPFPCSHNTVTEPYSEPFESRSHLHVVSSRSFHVILPCIYLVSHNLTAYAFIVLIPLYTTYWTIWLKFTPILPLPSRSISISSYNVRLVFPNYTFPIYTAYDILVLCLLPIPLIHSPAFYFANGTIV